MSPRIPRSAREALEGGVLAYLAVPTRAGPHLTPVVYVLDAGRLWVTTSRSSVKARAWRKQGTVAGMVATSEAFVTFRGRARTYDALDPLSWPASVVAGPRLLRAATRFGLKNARFFAGYAVDAGRVPLAWMPPGRVFAGIELTSGRVTRLGDGVSADEWGVWRLGSEFRKSFAHLAKRRGLDLRAPWSVRRALGRSGTGALALEGPEGLTVLPGHWRRVGGQGSYEVIVPRSVLELAGAGPAGRAALAVDRPSVWRASDMVGMLMQGTADLFAPAATNRGRRALLERLGAASAERAMKDPVLVRLLPDRVVWWHGWTSGSAVGRRPGDSR
jgi:hypothetical protein